LGCFLHGADDRTRLRTLLAQIHPEEVVLPRDSLSELTWSVLRKDLPVHAWEKRNLLKPGVEYWDAMTTQYVPVPLSAGSQPDSQAGTRGFYLQYFAESCPSHRVFVFLFAFAWQPYSANLLKEDYFVNQETGMCSLPPTLAALPVPSAASAASETALIWSALGGATWYLKRVLLDTELLSLGNFKLFDAAQPTRDTECLMLDGTTLYNLEILSNSDGSSTGSLISFIDKTVTSFGKRRFRQWVSRPLFKVVDIQERLTGSCFIHVHLKQCLFLFTVPICKYVDRRTLTTSYSSSNSMSS
jgi:hypothetical protein